MLITAVYITLCWVGTPGWRAGWTALRLQTSRSTRDTTPVSTLCRRRNCDVTRSHDRQYPTRLALKVVSLSVKMGSTELGGVISSWMLSLLSHPISIDTGLCLGCLTAGLSPQTKWEDAIFPVLYICTSLVGGIHLRRGIIVLFLSLMSLASHYFSPAAADAVVAVVTFYHEPGRRLLLVLKQVCCSLQLK